MVNTNIKDAARLFFTVCQKSMLLEKTVIQRSFRAVGIRSSKIRIATPASQARKDRGRMECTLPHASRAGTTTSLRTGLAMTDFFDIFRAVFNRPKNVYGRMFFTVQTLAQAESQTRMGTELRQILS